MSRESETPDQQAKIEDLTRALGSSLEINQAIKDFLNPEVRRLDAIDFELIMTLVRAGQRTDEDSAAD